MGAGQLLQHVQVACHQMVLGDDDYWIAKFGQHFQTTAREPKPALDGLIRISDAAQGDDLWGPIGRGQFLAEQFWRVLFDHDLAFEIQPC